MLKVTKCGSVRVEYETNGDTSSLSVYDASGLVKCSGFFTKDGADKLQDLIKTYNWIKGAKSYYSRALNLMAKEINNA